MNSLIIKTELFNNKIKLIKPIGFYVLTYLLNESKGSQSVNTSKSFIGGCLDLDMRTINKYLLLLEEHHLISCNQNISSENKNALLEISIEQYLSIESNQIEIPSDVFSNNYKRILSQGWLLYCSIESMKYENKNIVIQHISDYIGVTRETIYAYMKILEEENLIDK